MKKNLSKRIPAFLLVIMLAVPACFCAFAETETINGNQTEPVEADSGETLVVNGDVTVEVMQPEDNVAVRAYSEGAPAEITVNGDVDITNDGSYAGAVVAYATYGGEATATVNGSVSADATTHAHGVEADAYAGGYAEVTTGDVAVENGNDWNSAVVLNAMDTGSEAVATVGNIDATAKGVEISVNGGSATVTTGTIEAEQTGIQVNYNPEYTTSISLAEFKTLTDGKDWVERQNSPPADDHSYRYTKIWKVGDNEYHEDGFFDGKDYYPDSYSKAITEFLPGEVTVTVNGDVNIEKESNGEAYGIKAVPDSRMPSLEVDITVNGSINVEAENGYVNGILLQGNCETDYDVKVEKDINVTSEGASSLYGMQVRAGTDSDIDINVGGIVSAVLEEGQDASVTGINVAASEGGDLSITIGKGIEAISEQGVEDVRVQGIFAHTDGEESTLTINVQNGGVKAIGENAKAVYATNGGGDMDISITGNVIATGNGLNISASGGNYMENGIVREVVPVSDTDVKVIGDVIADTVGVYISDMNKNATIDVLVDGTISGDTTGAAVMKGTILDNVTLTVWEIKPNDDGSVASDVSYTYDRETMKREEIFTENEEFEKQIQYIIKLEPNENATLSTEGTTEYEGYNVAHEGDTVVLKVNVADGYHIVNAYNGTDTKVELLRDENGNYYLVVPRGGAVLLSVTLEADGPAAPAPVAEEESS